MTGNALVVRELAAGYGDRTVLRGLDLAVAPGRITAIVGANACGKSTLLRTLSRLLSPAEGQVLLDGRSVHRIPARGSPAGWVSCRSRRWRPTASPCSIW